MSARFFVAKESCDGDLEATRKDLLIKAKNLGYDLAIEEDELYWSFQFGSRNGVVTLESGLPPILPLVFD